MGTRRASIARVIGRVFNPGAWNLGFWRIPDQVVRLGVLFTAAVVALVVMRARLIPDTFGEEGHYRASSRAQIAGLPLKYAGWQACIECHEEEAEAKAKSYHRALSCEVCHGPNRDHAEDPIEAQPSLPAKRATCVSCHGYLPARPTGFPQIVEIQHNPMQPCTTCHDPHDPTPKEVLEECSACHAQISRTKAVSHHAPLACQACHETPPEHMQSPRRNLPKKPTERAFCGHCHAKNAKVPEDIPQKIPRVEMATHGGTYLCWQCHYPHFPEAR